MWPSQSSGTRIDGGAVGMDFLAWLAVGWVEGPFGLIQWYLGGPGES